MNKRSLLLPSLFIAACSSDTGTTGDKPLITIQALQTLPELAVGASAEIGFLVKNTGSVAATGVVFEVNGSDSITVKTAEGCDVRASEASCDIGTLDAGQSLEKKITFEANAVTAQSIATAASSTEGGRVTGPVLKRDGMIPTGSSNAPSKLAWTFTTVASDNTGYEPQMKARPSGGVGVAYFRRRADDGVCTRLMNAPVSKWEVMYAETSGETFTEEVVAEVDLINLDGLSLAFDAAGQPAIAFMGGAEGAYRCGGTDIMLARRSGGRWTATSLDSDGMATPVFTADDEACILYQNTCNAAGQDVVGPWPALAFAGSQPFVAYRDIHFGFAQDDEKNADLEMMLGATDGTLDATYGGGVYTQAAISNGQPAVLHLNRFNGDHGEGLWVVRYDGAMWSKKRIATEIDVGYTLGFAATGDKLGAAYHARGKQKLYYLEAPDATNWTAPEVVDQDGDTGRSPSLAFDAAGAPALSYYLCGPYDPNGSECAPEKDALRYAVKINGRWETGNVRTERAVFDGVNTSLAFDGELPLIAFQAQSYDPSEQKVIRSLVIARATKK